MLLTIISLVVEMIGVLIISKYGMPNKKLYDSVLKDSSLNKKEETEIFVMSQYGLMLFLVGFILQMFSITLKLIY